MTRRSEFDDLVLSQGLQSLALLHELTDLEPGMRSTDSRAALAVIGAGTLGWQIAYTFGRRGVAVRLYDQSPAALERGIAQIQQEAHSNGETIATVAACDSLETALEQSWMVIEAIPEVLDLKRRFFAELSALVDPTIVLASNSSSYKSRAFADV